MRKYAQTTDDVMNAWRNMCNWDTARLYEICYTIAGTAYANYYEHANWLDVFWTSTRDFEAFISLAQSQFFELCLEDKIGV